MQWCKFKGTSWRLPWDPSPCRWGVVMKTNQKIEYAPWKRGIHLRPINTQPSHMCRGPGWEKSGLHSSLQHGDKKRNANGSRASHLLGGWPAFPLRVHLCFNKLCCSTFALTNLLMLSKASDTDVILSV